MEDSFNDEPIESRIKETIKEINSMTRVMNMTVTDLKKCESKEEYVIHLGVIKDNLKNFIKRISKVTGDI
jgi:hypothetical protein